MEEASIGQGRALSFFLCRMSTDPDREGLGQAIVNEGSVDGVGKLHGEVSLGAEEGGQDL